MREFMHYITNAFYGATGWNDDNTYKELNATARGTPYLPLTPSPHAYQHLTPNPQSSSTSPSLEASA